MRLAITIEQNSKSNEKASFWTFGIHCQLVTRAALSDPPDKPDINGLLFDQPYHLAGCLCVSYDVMPVIQAVRRSTTGIVVGSVPSITNSNEVVTDSGEDLEACETALGYQFRDKSLLRWCLTHASASRTRLESNERLEFLGDAIMGAVVCELLFEQFPSSAEGELTRIKSIVVSRTTCALIARELNLERFLVVGRGVSSTARTPGSILAALLEALFGGIYLDGGYDAARTVIRAKLAHKIASAAQSETGVNFKSLLQHLAQKNYGQTPLYTVLDEKGPDHAKCFQISAVINGQSYPGAWGPCKKAAEQRAAHNALASIDGQPLPFPPEHETTGEDSAEV